MNAKKSLINVAGMIMKSLHSNSIFVKILNGEFTRTYVLVECTRMYVLFQIFYSIQVTQLSRSPARGFGFR